MDSFGSPIFAFATSIRLAFRGVLCHAGAMKTRITYWKETDGKYLGYLNDYPDHWTQGEDLEDLKAHLRDLFETFSCEEIPGIKREAELEIA